ncbi:hypothetical protein DAPPUDRAFT_306500 [Daphnia pulex]|uniref:Uncharacterized protein n=1 Tax=Daphnia pulex TaxID=6669 RepID=E9FYD7_DAPPU|nr:hypothetical protein DAPPUDRAFT_306500 [Daphnia pulex]|eukprot:EFX87514.1 hypothetical protein DAPPUDRAFT_306500 [Daphnia pulex]
MTRCASADPLLLPSRLCFSSAPVPHMHRASYFAPSRCGPKLLLISCFIVEALKPNSRGHQQL